IEHPLVADAEVDSLAQVEDRPERAVFLPRTDDRFDRGATDVANAAESEADLRLADHRELVAGFVDVRRQDLEPRLLCAGHVKLPRLVDVLNHVVRVADLR